MAPKIRILIIGNGFGGVYALKNLSKVAKNTGMELSMVGEKNYFLFTPLLHEVATGGLNPSNIIEPLREVLGGSLSNFYLGKAEEINLEEKIVKVNGLSISYDYLILAPGATTNFYGIPGAEQHALPLKNIEDAVRIKNRCIAQIEQAVQEKNIQKIKSMLHFTVVGGGPTGVELAAEMEELISESFSSYYPKDVLRHASITLIQRTSELVSQFHPKIRAKSLAVLRKKGIEVLLDTTVQKVGPSYLVVNQGSKIESETVIWVAGIKPSDVRFTQPIERAKDGRIIVNEYLQISGHENAFVLGDAAAFLDKDEKYVPALAQAAQKESESIARNIIRKERGLPLIPFRYKSSGYLISLGQWMAAGEIGGLILSGPFMWWLWRTIYLAKFISWRKKIRIAIDWTINIFSPRDISEL